MCTVSIIVPVYNVEKYLRECVDSIICQTYKDWELILVDDGSKDASGYICDEYSQKDSRIKAYHKINGGVSTARNVGIENAQGEYIAFVDADDTIEKDYIFNLIVGKQDIDLVIGGYKSIPDKLGQKIFDEYIVFNLSELSGKERFIRRLLYFPWGRIYKNSIIKNYNLRFCQELRLSEDTEFTANYLIYCKSVSFISNCDYNYRIGTGIAKYCMTYSELRLHIVCFEKTFSILSSSQDIDLNEFKENLFSTLFFYYKSSLEKINNFKSYKSEVCEWNTTELNTLLECLKLRKQKWLYKQFVEIPLLGFVYFRIKNYIKLMVRKHR